MTFCHQITTIIDTQRGKITQDGSTNFFMEYIDRGIRFKGRFVEMNGKILVYTIMAKTGHEICNMADSDQ